MKRYLIPVRRLKNIQLYNKIAGWITHKAGSPIVSIIAFLVVILWGITGPFFGFSDSWQLVINTGTTIITFMMVFIIQQSQNKDTAAIHLKLNELIASNEKASNRLVDIEELTDEELVVLRNYYISLADKAEKELDLHSSHSLDEAEENHNLKLRSIKRK
jgi:low affinity Fe/Cu permease